jgi:hypothetical protein
MKNPRSIVRHNAFFTIVFLYVISLDVIQIGFCIFAEVCVFIKCCQFIGRYLRDVDSDPVIAQVLREIIRYSFHVA